jgi:hypothetical protein
MPTTQARGANTSHRHRWQRMQGATLAGVAAHAQGSQAAGPTQPRRIRSIEIRRANDAGRFLGSVKPWARRGQSGFQYNRRLFVLLRLFKTRAGHVCLDQ